MFEVPQAKRIKRSELYDDDPDKSNGQELPHPSQNRNDEDFQTLPYTFDYDLIPPQNPPSVSQPTHQPESTSTEADPETSQFEFRLFHSKPKSTTEPSIPNPSATTTDTARTHANQLITITLRSPSPPTRSTSPGNFISAPRAQSYYLTSALSTSTLSTLRSQYKSSAISTSTLSTLSALPWPGTRLPWKLFTFKAPPASSSSSTSTPTAKAPAGARRNKPSKKRRIMIRQLLAKRKDWQTQKVEAEAAEREKRTRRNREKKVKRKEREKRKKSAGTGVVEDGGAEGKEEGGQGE